MGYKLRKEFQDMRIRLNSETVFDDYCLGYMKLVKELGYNQDDYCLPITKYELQLLDEGGGHYKKTKIAGLYKIHYGDNLGTYLGVEDYDGKE